MKQSTTFAQVATNLLNVLQGCSKSIRLLLVMFLTLTVTTNAWGATYTLDQASLKTSKSAYQTSDYTHTATDGSKWVLNGYGIITTNPKHIQLGKASKNYIKTPTCTGNITEVSITFAKACSYYIAIWDMDGNIASSTIASKPAANSTKTFTISGEHKQLQIIGTRTSDGTSITTSNAAAYISSITITYETAASYTVTYNANGGSGTMSNSTGSSIKIKECTFTAPECKQFTSWNTADNGSGISYAPNATVATNLTLYAQWENLPSYTVKLMDNDEVLTSSCNTPISLPDRNCDGYTFVGWTKTWTEEQEEWTTTAPTIIPKGSYTPTANESLYPVYTKTEGGGSEPTAYSAGDVGSFIIASNVGNKWYAIPETPTLSSSKITGVEITVSQTDGGVKYVSTANAEGYTWTIANATNGQTISDGSKYIYHSNGGASGTNLAYGTSTSYTWKIEKENNGLTFQGMNGSTTNSRGLLFNGSVFGGYALSNEDASGYYRIQVLPIGGGSTTYYISVPDCGDPCDQLGAATNLTVETDFVQDGQTYVKFSWTPADNTKNYATSQKLCFGKVGEAGTCVDDLEKNLTWTGDLKSKLEPGEYWWSIQALGDGVNYCDGDVVKGTNFTIEAPTYTVTFDAGSGTCGTESLTETSGGAGVTLPTANPPAACATDGWNFAGWWTEAVAGTTTSPGTLLNADDTYNPTSDITLYAVYSTQEAGDAFTGYAKVTEAPEDWSGKYLLSTGTYTANGTYDSNGANGHLVRETYTPGNEEKAAWEFTLAKVDVDGNTVGYSILFPDGSSYLGYASSTNFARSVNDLSKDNNAYLWTPSTDGITNVKESARKIADNGDADFRPYSNPSSNIVYLYKRVGGGATTIYNSNPTCIIPVWEGATIDKTNLIVNCGERSPMTGQNGAAKITFPTEKIYNFTKDITIEATTGFLVSTSQTEDANYKSLVSLSPLVGTANANTFYNKFVYVRAEAPAQSDTDLEGTITIKNSKGETLQTFSVTADVTCTQYTLTLVDRGVSTEQPTKYYAGETIDEDPADPEGVCTDPIHYVFDGWAAATVSEGSTTYTKVAFPYTVTGNTKFYAVYRYVSDGGEPSNDFIKVTKEKDDWTGDYVIVDEDAEKAIGNAYQNTNTLKAIDVEITDNKVISPSNDIIWQIRKHGENYTMYNASANEYAYIAKADAKGAGLSATTTNTTQDIQIIFNNGTAKVSGVDIYRCFYYYGTNTEWRTYATGNYNTGALYCRSLESYLYTTSPVCGPHLAITEGKDIYVTGGNAGGTRDLVIAQTKVSYKATRLEKDKSTGNLPSIKALPSNIVFDNTKTKAVAVTFDEDSVRTLQSDGTYTITGNITIAYQPAAANVTDDIQVTLNANYNPSADVSQASFTVHARSLPSEFVIVAKSGDKWYALNGDMNINAANPANGQVTLDNDANPTKATYAPCNTIYTFDGLPNTGDRTCVRFQGTDGAWLWAASGTNVGIQNNVLKTTPEGSNKAYNWKLYTEDNITYRFGNANSSRQLTLNGEKFGMYASGVQDIRILPYVEKCLYNYAPSNLKVSVLKGSYVTLTWDAVAGATKYQYSTNGTTWMDAGTEPTVTINGLEGANEYTYYIRAYHEDAGVTNECIDYAEITFTTADCDDVPTDITYTADLNSITVSWTAAAPTATIKLYLDENGEHAFFTQNGTTSPWRISTLSKNTTYYLQIFSDGTCASPIIPVKTEDVEVDIVEWQPQGIVVDINTDETIGVTLENEVSYGSGLGTEATELFFSKYYEASYNVKLVAIYNGTKNIIDLTDYIIKYGKTSWETNYITLKDFGATKGQIQPGEEIILYSMQDGTQDDDIMDCVHEDFPDGNWVRVTSSNNTGKGTLAFAGDKTLALFKGKNIIDIIGAVNGSNPNNSKANEKPTWGDANGWICATGLSIADDSEIGISTNRCLLVRNNTVTSGANAVASNTTDFVTLCSEWKGAHVLDSDVDNGIQESCENFAYVGTFDYSDYYTKYESMGEGTTFEENDRNPDGTVTIPITDLYKHACSNIRVKLTNSNGEVLSDREYKVPIMITTNQGTDGEAFIALQQNLATKEVDGEGNVIATYPLSLDQVREICKTCDVVIRNNAILTKAADDAADDHPEVRDVYVYQNSSLIVPAGTNYTINNLSLRRKQDTVASLNVSPDALKLPESAAAPISLDFRLSAESWHWFTLPFDCNISEVTWIDGSTAQYNVDWFLMTYDGEKRAATQAGGCWKAYTGTTIKAGEGFILAINGNINNPAHTYELRFPMSKEVLAAEGTDKTVDVRAWGVETNIRPNHKGWNLVGNPYLAYYQRNNITNFEGLRLGQLTGPDPQTGYWEQTGDVPYVVVPVGAGWIAYEQVLASETDLLPFTAYFVQVGNDGTHNSTQDLKVAFDHTKLQLSATPMPASIIQRSATEASEPVIVGVSLTNAKGESDKTSLIIDNQYTNEYEMHADFFKWFGDYYKYYTKPVLYTVGADQGKRAFNAISEDLAAQPISLGMFAAQTGNYTFSLDLRSDLSKVQEVWLYDAIQDTYTNLLQDSYTFQTAKTESAGRFFLSVKMAPKVSTDIDNITSGSIWATTQDHTIIVNGLLSNALLWIYDATGKLLHTDQTQYYQHTYQVPVSGTYFVRVQNTMQTQTIKVVVE